MNGLLPATKRPANPHAAMVSGECQRRVRGIRLEGHLRLWECGLAAAMCIVLGAGKAGAESQRRKPERTPRDWAPQQNLVFSQELENIRHRYYDPLSGKLQYEVRARFARSRTEGTERYLDAGNPEMDYFGQETVRVTSTMGTIDLRRETILLMGQVQGYLSTNREARFLTEQLTVDFQGNGRSDKPTRFTYPGVVIDGKRSEFTAKGIPSDAEEGTPDTERVFRVWLYGPGEARFEKASARATLPGATGPLGTRFTVLFNGSAQYVQGTPAVVFLRNPSDPEDRVVIHGETYALKCDEFRVRGSPQTRTWEGMDALGRVSYETLPQDPTKAP